MTAATLAPTPIRRPWYGWAARDAVLLVGRTLRRSTREVDALLMAVMLPVMLMLTFVYVFGGAMSAVPHYVDYVVPGIVLLCTGFVSAATAVSVASDMTGGLMDRFRSMPLRPSAVLVGHVVGSLVRNIVSTTLVIGVALAIGFRPSAGPVAWLGAAGLLVAWALAITWVAVWLGLLASSPEAASGFTFAVLFLPYVSSAFVPPATMPRVLEVIATYQPVTPVTDTVRAWLLGADVGANPWVALAWCAGIGGLAWVGAVQVFRRRTAR
jgi:ABC-2 type transport system permease protein